MFNKNDMLKAAQELRRQQNGPFSRENRILTLSCANPETEPREIGDLCTARFGAIDGVTVNGERVISVYRRNDLGKVQKRISLCRTAWETAASAVSCWRGEKQADWDQISAALGAHRHMARLVLLSMVEQAGDLFGPELCAVIDEFSRLSSRDFLAALAESDRCTDHTTEDESIEASLRRRLEFADREWKRLKGQMRERVEEAVLEEREQFFMQLNQEEYSHILDLLSMAQTGFARLRTEGKTIPMEIRCVQTLVRSMRRFMTDYGVVPLAEPGQMLELSAREMDDYIYEGTAFRSDRERKCVEVVSSGWEMPDRNLVISYPKVREITRV